MGPGVVRFPASLSTGVPSGANAPSVPIDPVGHSNDRTCRPSVTDVVFPLVPVTPTRLSFLAGNPNHTSAATAAARRPSFTTTWGNDPGCGVSTSAAAAPCSVAWDTYVCPSCTAPRTAQYSMP